MARAGQETRNAAADAENSIREEAGKAGRVPLTHTKLIFQEFNTGSASEFDEVKKGEESAETIISC